MGIPPIIEDASPSSSSFDHTMGTPFGESWVDMSGVTVTY